MKTAKKWISLLLVFALCFAIPAAALDNNNQLNCEVEKEASATYTNMTIFEGIKASDNGQYAISSTDGGEVPVGMLQVDLLDEEQYSAVLTNPDLSEPVKESLASKRDHALEIGESKQYVFIFSPRLLDENTAGTYAIPAGRTEYTWNGHKFMIERVYTYDVHSGFEYIQRGVSTKQVASTITDITLGVASLSNKFSFAASGISLLKIFLNALNLSNANYISGFSDDYIQADVISDVCEQWTWGKHLSTDPDWFLGVYTRRVFVKQVRVEQYYYVSSLSGYKLSPNTIYPNHEIKGAHFTDDWQQACSYAWDGRMSTLTDPAPTWTLGNKTFVYYT